MRILVPILFLFLTSCTTIVDPITPTAPSKYDLALPTEIPPGTMVETIHQSTGTPEANPVLTIDVDAMDEISNAPVKAAFFWVSGEGWREPTMADLIIADTDKIQMNMPSGSMGWLVVRAVGYEE